MSVANFLSTQCTIASGASASNTISLGNDNIVGVKIPPLGVSATVTLWVSRDSGSTFQETFLDNSNGQGVSAYLVAGSANTNISGIYVAMNPLITDGIDYCQFVLSLATTSPQTLTMSIRQTAV